MTCSGLGSPAILFGARSHEPEGITPAVLQGWLAREAPKRNGSVFQADIDAIQRIGAVPKILNVICRTTGMGFAAVARVTENRWILRLVRRH
jgi:hypothetical protein